MNPPGKPTPTTQKLSELEGLRAWLAWWVVIGHSFIEAGWQADWLPVIGKVLLSPGLGVKIFIILSGFVITLLLDQGRPNYRTFITARAFRIFPLYYVMLIISAASIHWMYSFYPAYLERIGNPAGLVHLHETWAGHIAHFSSHILICLTGLHGSIPASMLPYAQSAFLSQAWSISLEWQFYLAAPLIWWLLQRRFGLVAVSLVFYAVIGLRHHFEIGGWSSFLPQSIEFFAIGAVSYFAYKQLKLESSSPNAYARALLYVMLLVIGFVPVFTAAALTPWQWGIAINHGLPLGLWMIVLALVIARKHAGDHPFVRIASYPLTNKVALFLGRISYSTYLVHYLVIYLLQYAMLQLAPHAINKWTMAGVLCSVGAALTLLLSTICHRWIELPGIAFGKKMVAKKKVFIPAPQVGLPT